MSRLRNISREGWMVFTAVLTAIAVIAAMIAVPGARARAAEPTDFVPNKDLGTLTNDVNGTGSDSTWGALVWAGAVEPSDFVGKNYQGSPDSNVGWAWCIDPAAVTPLNQDVAYLHRDAEKLRVTEHRDAVFNLAVEMQKAVRDDRSQDALNYNVYLAALVGRTASDRTAAAQTITGTNGHYGMPATWGVVHYPGFDGSPEEFTQLTGLKIVSDFDPPKYELDPDVEIPQAAEDSFITVIVPKGANGKPCLLYTSPSPRD